MNKTQITVKLTAPERAAVMILLAYATRLLATEPLDDSDDMKGVLQANADALLRFSLRLRDDEVKLPLEDWRVVYNVSTTLMSDEMWFDLRDFIRGYRCESRDVIPETTVISAEMIMVEKKVWAAVERSGMLQPGRVDGQARERAFAECNMSLAERKAILYCRGRTAEEQKQALLSWAERIELRQPLVQVEEGDNQAILHEALSLLSAKRYDLLVVFSLDRISRHFDELAKVLSQSEAEDWDVISLDGLDTRDPLNRLPLALAQPARANAAEAARRRRRPTKD